MRTEVYSTQRRRNQLIKDALTRKESMLTDTDIGNGQHEATFDLSDNRRVPKTPEQILLELLLVKLKNNTITVEQLKTLIRLEHGFELTQTTRDKILIAVQGIIGTLRDRIINVFNL